MAKESRSDPGDAGYGVVSELGEKYGIKTSSLDLALCWPIPFIEKLFEEITKLKTEIEVLQRGIDEIREMVVGYD